MMDFPEVVEEFKNRRRLDEAADSTVKRYVRNLRSWREWLTDTRGKEVWDADHIDLSIYIEERSLEGLAATTISQRVASISKFYQDMQTLEDRDRDIPAVPENPYEGLSDEDKGRLKGDTKKKSGLEDTAQEGFIYLTSDEINQLANNVPSPKLRNELIVRLMFRCGFRRGELSNCKLEHLDREDKSILIPPRKSEEKRLVSYSDPDEESESHIEFELSQWLDYGRRDSMVFSDDSEYLFPTNNSPHISGNYLNDMIKIAAENAGLQEILNEYSSGQKIHKITAHTLRHSFAMQCVKSGIHVKTLQTLMGHTEIETTMIYLEQSMEEAKNESRQFDASL